MRRTPTGVARLTGPAMSVTSAPAFLAARAISKPWRPLERLVTPRTGSIASYVGPAVMMTRFPESVLGEKSASASSQTSAGSIMRPAPLSPQA